MGTRIIGCGKALPQLEICNDDLAALVNTSDEWIYPRTGIRSRHVAVGESTLSLAKEAALQALGQQGLDGAGWALERVEPSSIDLLICATLTPDTLIPSTAAGLKRTLGLENAVAFDMNAACSGFIYGLCVADSMLAASSLSVGPNGRQVMRRALVVGVDRLSRLLDWGDRSTCVLFGDGAGAAVVEWDELVPGIIATYLKTIDDVDDTLTCAAVYGNAIPFDEDGVAQASVADPSLVSARELLGCEAAELRPSVKMLGQPVFKFASKALCDAIEGVLERASLSLDDIDLIVPHQANERIIQYAAKRLGLGMEMFELRIANTGNTSAASVPMALSDAYASGRIRRGGKVIAAAFGGGLTYGAVLFEA